MAARKYQIGFWCAKGGGHGGLFSTRNAVDPMCGNGWPIYIDLDPEDIEMAPEGHFNEES